MTAAWLVGEADPAPATGISKEGLILWECDCGSREDCIAAYRDELGSEALDYDAVDPHWMDGLEVRRCE